MSNNIVETKKDKKSNVLLAFILLLIPVVYYMFFYIKIENISLLSETKTMYIGETLQLDYELLLNRENVSEERYIQIANKNPVEWFTGNSNVAEITQDGKLTAFNKGPVVVGIRCGEVSTSVVMEVCVPVEEIILEDIVLNTYKKQSGLKYRLVPADAYVTDLKVEIADENIASYSDGMLHSNAIGETTLTLSSGNVSAETVVKVKQATEEIKANNLNIVVASGGKLYVTTSPKDAEVGLNFKYKSSDESIAKVNENGWVSGLKSGEATVTVTNEFGQTCESKVTVQGYPLTYKDGTSNITIYREWYGNAYVYAAHVTFSDYSRFGTACGKNVYGGTETTSSAAARQGAILCINGCYSAPYLNYATVRSGVLCQDGKCYSPGVYSKNNGLLLSAWESGGVAGYTGVMLSSLVASGAVTDTFTFGPPFLMNGAVVGKGGGSRAQRTFIGTNGNPGDIWLCVSDGRYNDGVSAGLTGIECAQYLQSKGCTLGVPLDGGGSSTMVFRGNVLNAAVAGQRSVVDFVYFR